MAEYHVRRGLAGIYAGTLKNGKEWQNKTDVTNEAIREVGLYLLENDLNKIEVRIGSKKVLYLVKVESLWEWEWKEPEINPCRGCEDYDEQDGCLSNGGCAPNRED